MEPRSLTQKTDWPLSAPTLHPKMQNNHQETKLETPGAHKETQAGLRDTSVTGHLISMLWYDIEQQCVVAHYDGELCKDIKHII